MYQSILKSALALFTTSIMFWATYAVSDDVNYLSSVVKVEVLFSDGAQPSTANGSAFFIFDSKADNTSTLVTANHIFDQPRKVDTIYVHVNKNGNITRVRGTYVNSNLDVHDIAILRIRGVGYEKVNISSEIKFSGEDMWAVGFPAGSMEHRVNDVFGKYTDSNTKLNLNSTFSEGMSGGPVYTENNQVVAILTVNHNNEKSHVASLASHLFPYLKSLNVNLSADESKASVRRKIQILLSNVVGDQWTGVLELILWIVIAIFLLKMAFEWKSQWIRRKITNISSSSKNRYSGKGWHEFFTKARILCRYVPVEPVVGPVMLRQFDDAEISKAEIHAGDYSYLYYENSEKLIDRLYELMESNKLYIYSNEDLDHFERKAQDHVGCTKYEVTAREKVAELMRRLETQGRFICYGTEQSFRGAFVQNPDGYTIYEFHSVEETGRYPGIITKLTHELKFSYVRSLSFRNSMNYIKEYRDDNTG